MKSTIWITVFFSSVGTILAIPGDTYQYLVIPGNTEQYQTTPKNTKQHQTTPNNTKQYQTTPNNTKKYKKLQTIPNRLAFGIIANAIPVSSWHYHDMVLMILCLSCIITMLIHSGNFQKICQWLMTCSKNFDKLSVDLRKLTLSLNKTSQVVRISAQDTE